MNIKRSKSLKQWVIAGGIFNCIAAFPLAMPFLYKWYINLFNKLNSFLNLGGTNWISPTEGINMLFLNTAGLALFLVGLILLYSSRNINERIEIAFFNGIVRFIWGLTAIYYLVNYEIINILYVLVGIDFIFASVYIYYFLSIRTQRYKN